jgi:lipopolysaccharide/colanic/teichoic acid biosynthesis glycosyltransferase
LLKVLDNQADSNFLNSETQKFIQHFKESLNFRSSSDVYLDLSPLNRRIKMNQYLSQLNSKMSIECKEFYFGFAQTTEDIKKSSIFFDVPFIKFLLFSFLFIFRRFLPKVTFFKNIKFMQGMRIYSQAEIMGRLHYNGFRIIEFDKLENNIHFFIAKLESQPLRQHVQEGFLIRLARVGKNGKKFNVFKFRTMHPYSEFIHKYMIENYGFNEKGKIKNDFRTSGWGKFLRKTWIDEIPQIINLLKGDMKIFGVRPVSESYLSTLSRDFQEVRNNQKPGCIPPYLVFSEGTSKEAVIESEKKYLKKCEENRTFWRDLKYTLMAMNNILIKGRRSS